MKNKKRISVRFDERTTMQLLELSSMTNQSLSCIIRAFVIRSLDKCVDERGYIIPHERTKGKENK